MRRIGPVVLSVLFSALPARAAVELSVDRVGNFGVQNGGALVDVYRLTVFSDSDLISGFSFSMTGGYQIGAPGSPPFGDFLTPTVTEAASLPAVLRPADTHFLLNSADFVPAITSPGETNDFSFGAQPSWSEGIGGLTVQSGLALSAQASCVTLVNIAAMDGEGVAIYGMVVGEKGGAEHDLMRPLVPWSTFDDPIGGPYCVAPGQILTLDGSAGTGIASWRWDLDDDLEFDDATGQFADVDYDYLVDTLGLSMGRYAIGLERETSGGVLSRAWTQLDIVPEPATLSLLALGGLAVLRRRQRIGVPYIEH